jgi:hypothetical protein
VLIPKNSGAGGYPRNAASKVNSSVRFWFGRIRALTLERGCVPQSGTSRSSFAKPACWNTPDAAELFHVLRLVLCTQPRSNPDAPF